MPREAAETSAPSAASAASDAPPPRSPFFSLPNPHTWVVALALDLLLQPQALQTPPGVDMGGIGGVGGVVRCMMCSAHVPAWVIQPGERHFVPCRFGMRLSGTCHDPTLHTLVALCDASFGAANVIAERGGAQGDAAMQAFMLGAGAGLSHQPDLVLVGFDGPGSHLLVDLKTLDTAGATHVATHHTDRSRLAAHAAEVTRCEHSDYRTHLVPLPRGMRLVVFVISTFGSLGGPAQTLLSELVLALSPFVCVLRKRSSWP